MWRRGVALGLVSAEAAALLAVVAWALVTRPAVGAEPWTQFGLAVVEVVLAALLTLRVPGNRVAWVVAASAAATVLMVVAGPLGELGGLATWLAGWLATWVWLVAMGAVVTLGALWFPTGGPPSPRWRWVGRVVLVAAGTTIVVGALAPADLLDGAGTGPTPSGTDAVLVAAYEVSVVAVAALAPVCVASLVLRYRRARGLERVQLQWVTWAVAVAVVAYLTGDLTTRLPLVTWPLLTYGGLALVFTAITVAVLRYRVWDLGRLVTRTVSWTMVSLAVGGTYGLVVLGAQLVAGPDGGGDLGVAAATLVAAAVVRPVRGRLQRVVDRRFHRGRYDVQEVVEAFGAGLRDVVEDDRIANELCRAVVTALQPAGTQVWLRSPRG